MKKFIKIENTGAQVKVTFIPFVNLTELEQIAFDNAEIAKAVTNVLEKEYSDFDNYLIGLGFSKSRNNEWNYSGDLETDIRGCFDFYYGINEIEVTEQVAIDYLQPVFNNVEQDLNKTGMFADDIIFFETSEKIYEHLCNEQKASHEYEDQYGESEDMLAMQSEENE